MKFSDIEQSQWPALQPYLDTCLLPVTGLNGSEEPWQATYALEQLRDLLDLVEIPFKGRIVTYPALHYIHGQTDVGHLSDLCSSFKKTGFAYVILAGNGINGSLPLTDSITGCDLVLSHTELSPFSINERQKLVQERITAIWSRSQ
jgi:23S rRNA (pseudouridine1915-N3)-methyltransferase